MELALRSTPLGKKVSKIQVLELNGEKSKSGKSVVNCRCLAWGKPFSVNGYHVKYQKAKSCGCVRICKANSKAESKRRQSVKRSVKG